MKSKVALARPAHISVDWIANRISLWAIVATTVSIVVFTASTVFTQVQASSHEAQEAMTKIIPRIAESLSSELMIGDENSMDLLITDLKKQFELRSLEFTTNENACVRTGWDIRRLVPWLEVCQVIPVREVGANLFLLIASDIKNIGFFRSLSTVLWVCIPLILFGIYSTLRLRRELERSLTKPIKELADNPEQWSGNNQWVAQEAVALHQQLKRYIMERDIERDRTQALKLEASIGQIATQVAHDIRSPLAALDMIASDLKPLPEEKRVLIRSAVARIRDIANGLVDKHRQMAFEHSSSIEGVGANGGKSTTELLSSLIEALVSEKRVQYRSRIGLQIDAPLTRKAYGLFAELQPVEFKRALSNLIDNAVQSISTNAGGRVSVDLEGEDSDVLIRVRDSGTGIPKQLLPKLMQKGASFFKPGGTGLGLYHARNCMERWGGTLKIDSTEGRGTTLEIRLPKAPFPKWFVPEVELRDVSHIVILDDDTSIHYIWRGRFESARVREKNIDILHFSTESQIRDWYRDKNTNPQKVLFLVDYELSDGSKNGLEIIEELQIQTQSILVTSRFEEPSIRQHCARLEVRLIPKSLAGFIPISL